MRPPLRGTGGVRIPFNKPRLAGDELAHIREAIELQQLAGDGAFTARCQEWLRDEIGAQAVLLTHSCTAALEMAAILVGIEPGDEVIMPSFTFVSTANAVVLRGGVPVFVDIRPDTLNLDERLVEEAITPRTKAILPVHYAGIVAEMTPLCSIANAHGLVVVEDAAQAFGSRYRGRQAGSIGSLSTFSFHETKNVISGEGGALAINDPAFIARAEIIRDKGTNRKRFIRGEVDKYTWVDIGSSFLPGELIASFLYGQLEQGAKINADRLKSWRTYDSAIRPLSRKGFQVPTVPAHCDHNGHLYYMLMPTPALRDEMIVRLRADGIAAPFHYVPLHSSEAGQRYARASGALPVTESASARLVRLPLYPSMDGAAEQVVEAVAKHLDSLL